MRRSINPSSRKRDARYPKAVHTGIIGSEFPQGPYAGPGKTDNIIGPAPRFPRRERDHIDVVTISIAVSAPRLQNRGLAPILGETRDMIYPRLQRKGFEDFDTIGIRRLAERNAIQTEGQREAERFFHGVIR